MIKNYFKIAWRNLQRNKLRTFIHILGLSIGLSICFLIFNLLVYAYSFDGFHPDKDRIYRVNTEENWGGDLVSFSGTPGPLGEVIDSEITGVENKARLYTLWETMVVLPETNQVMGRTNNVTFSDGGFFEIFPRTWLAGNPENALEKPYTVVIAESVMQKYFPGKEPLDVLGRELTYIDTDTIRAEVTGIVEDFKKNSDLIFTDFISFSTIDSQEKKEWFGLHSWTNLNSSSQLFVKTTEGVSKAQIDEAFGPLAEKNYKDKEETDINFFLEPLAEFHFNDNYDNTTISKTFLNGLIYIGLIILVLATLNFINLETAQAMGRAKEVGIRKSLGGVRGQLIFQFLSETYLIVIGSMLVGIALVEVLKVTFSSYLPVKFAVNYLSGINLLFYILFPILLTALAGIYPSLVLSGYKPQRALKGEHSTSRGFSLGAFMRKNLTILQFSSSIAFIILVLVLNYQIKYVTSQPMGFDKDFVMYTRLPFMSGEDRMESLKDRMLQESQVSSASLSGSLVSSGSLWTSDVGIPVDTTFKEFNIQVMNVDSAFIRTNGIPLIAGVTGHNLSDEVLVNERFIDEAGYSSPEDAIGREVRFGGEIKKIVGVTGDFHSRTLREEVRPLLFTINRPYFSILSVKLQNGQNLALARENLDRIFREVYPYETASFQFLDTEMDKFYQEDLRIRNVLGFACILAILISSMGLFGLSSFTISQRLKEISIRKVLGATIPQILGMISKEYVILVLISFAIAIYPAYYFLRDWLNGFEYRVDMPYFLFALSGIGVLLICLLIVGAHSFVAAQSNPAKVLKDE